MQIPGSLSGPLSFAARAPGLGALPPAVAAFYWAEESTRSLQPWSQGFVPPGYSQSPRPWHSLPWWGHLGAGGLESIQFLVPQFPHQQSQGPDFPEGCGDWASVEASSANFKALQSQEAASWLRTLAEAGVGTG